MRSEDGIIAYVKTKAQISRLLDISRKGIVLSL